MGRPLTIATNREQSFLKQAALGSVLGLWLDGVVVQAGAIQRRAAIASYRQLPVVRTTRLCEPGAERPRIPGGLAVCHHEQLDDDPRANEDLAVIVQDFETGDPLDLLGNLVVELFLPGEPQVANLVGAPALDQCLLDFQESATKNDNQEVVVQVRLSPLGAPPKELSFYLANGVSRLGEHLATQVDARHDPIIHWSNMKAS